MDYKAATRKLNEFIDWSKEMRFDLYQKQVKKVVLDYHNNDAGNLAWRTIA